MESGFPLLALVPLAQASDGSFDPQTGTLFFTRLPRQSSHAKRYQGGLIEKIWKYEPEAAEAELLTKDYEGTSSHPMFWDGRVYFASDRDGTMNLWSMTPDGEDLNQHTEFQGWDVISPALHQGKIVFQKRADLWVYHIESDRTRRIPIRLASDTDQMREHWIDKPMEFLKEKIEEKPVRTPEPPPYPDKSFP